MVKMDMQIPHIENQGWDWTPKPGGVTLTQLPCCLWSADDQ